MSHFSVLVVGDSPDRETIAAALQPFHEFESTDIDDEYVVDVDVTDEALDRYKKDTTRRVKSPDGALHDPYEPRFYRDPTLEEIANHGPFIGSGMSGELSYTSSDWGDGLGYRAKIQFMPEGYEEVVLPAPEIETFVEWATGYYEIKPDSRHTRIVDGRIIKRTNPDAKWDWWSIGGRWQGSLQARPGADTLRGEGGTFHSVDNIPLKNADQVRKGDLDTEAMLAARREEVKKWFDGLIAKVKRPNPKGTLEDGIHTKNRLFAEWRGIEDEKKKRFWDWMKEHEQWYRIEPIADLSWDLPELEPGQTLQQYIDDLQPIQPYALLMDGRWYSKGDMGWFGVSSSENESWKGDFKTLFESITDDKWLTMVDCHI